MRRDEADRAAARDERNPQPGPGAEAANHVPVDIGIVEHRVAPLAATAIEDATALRCRPGHGLADEILRSLACDRDEPQLVPAGRQQHDDEAGIEQLAQSPCHEVEQKVDVGLRRERVADLVQGLELIRPVNRRLVQPRVLDRDGGLAARSVTMS